MVISLCFKVEKILVKRYIILGEIIGEVAIMEKLISDTEEIVFNHFKVFGFKDE